MGNKKLKMNPTYDANCVIFLSKISDCDLPVNIKNL